MLSGKIPIIYVRMNRFTQAGLFKDQLAEFTAGAERVPSLQFKGSFLIPL